MALTKDEAVKRLSTVIKPNASAQTAVQNQPVQTQAQQTQMPQIPQTDYQKAVSRLGGTATKQATPGLADELIRQNANRAAATLSNIPTFDDPYTLYDDLKSYRESADKALRDARNAALLFRDEENIANFKSAVDQYNRTIPGILEKYGNYATILSGDLSTATAADAKHIADLAKARAAELTPVSKKVIGEKPTFLELMAAQPLNPEQIYGGVKPGTVERRADISDEVKAEIEKYQSLADYYDYLNEWLSDAKNLKSRDEWINSGKDLESVYTQFKEARQKEGTWSNGQTREELETRLKDLQGEIAKHTAGGRRSQTLDAMLKEADGIRQQLKELPEYTMPEYGTTSFSDELLDLLTSGYGNLLLSSTQYKDIADELLDEIKSEASNLSGAYKDFMDYQQGGLWQAIEHAEGDEAELQALFARNPTAEEAYRTKVNFEKLQKQAELLANSA